MQKALKKALEERAKEWLEANVTQLSSFDAWVVENSNPLCDCSGEEFFISADGGEFVIFRLAGGCQNPPRPPATLFKKIGEWLPHVVSDVVFVREGYKAVFLKRGFPAGHLQETTLID